MNQKNKEKSSAMNTPSVVVIGAGVSGLTAAHELSERGYQVTVVERLPIVGGKARSYTGKLGLPSEHGFRFFGNWYFNLFRTLRKIETGQGTSLFDNFCEIERWNVDGHDLDFAKSALPNQRLHRIILRGLTAGDKRRFDEGETRSWTDELKRSTVSKQEQEQFPFYENTPKVFAATESAEASFRGASYFFTRGMAYPGVKILTGPSNEALFDLWQQHLEKNGVQFVLDVEVEALRVEEQRISEIKLKQGASYTPDLVVCTVPFEILAKLAEGELYAADPELKKIEQLKNNWLTGHQLFLEKPLDLKGCGHIGLSNAPWALSAIQQSEFWDETYQEQCRKKNCGAILSIIIGNWDAPGILFDKSARQCTLAELEEELWAQLIDAKWNELAKGLRNAKVLGWDHDEDLIVEDSRFVGHRAPLYSNDKNTYAHRPENKTNIANLFLAGDYTATITDVATMESASESGKRAVNAILAQAGDTTVAPCYIHGQPESPLFDVFKRIDDALYAAGYPHFLDLIQPSTTEFSIDVLETLLDSRTNHTAAKDIKRLIEQVGDELESKTNGLITREIIEQFLRSPLSNWPQSETIDLAWQDLPHVAADSESWSIKALVKTADGTDYALHASFVLRAVDGRTTGDGRTQGCFLYWALIDDTHKVSYGQSLVDSAAPDFCKALLQEMHPCEQNPLLHQALIDIFDTGTVPLPDELMQRRGKIDRHRLALDFDGRTFNKTDDGAYSVALFDRQRGHGCSLHFRLTSKATRLGADGLIPGEWGERSYSYCSPRNEVHGEIIVDGRPIKIESGTICYQHEFGAFELQIADEEPEPVRSTRGSFALSNGSNISLFEAHVASTSRPLKKNLDLFNDGCKKSSDQFTLSSTGQWCSSRSAASYPTAWTLSDPAARLQLEIKPSFAQQEFVTFVGRTPFWFGKVEVAGIVDGVSVTGEGFVEMYHVGEFGDFAQFLNAVSNEGRAHIERVLPKILCKEDLIDLVGARDNEHFIENIDLKEFAKVIVDPVREIADRGGKGWRSYCSLAACDAVGGNSENIKEWLAFTELLHVGSLIIDDIQDNSKTRRGGPVAHEIHGVPLSINAGNFCYFIPHIFLERLDLDPAKKVQIYDIFYAAMRAAHSGQALDIAGGQHLLNQATIDGCGAALEARALTVHRLKTAATAKAAGQIGALMGQGTQAQIHAIGDFFEAIGIAFQIIDDSLNLKGFAGDLKSAGEDLEEGKITTPVAKAYSILERRERETLSKLLVKRQNTDEELLYMIKMIGATGVYDLCEEDALNVIEEGWRRLDPMIDESVYKANLRAFGRYVIQRHY